VSPVIEISTGRAVAVTSPRKVRAAIRKRKVVAAPVAPMATHQSATATASSSVRRIRSARNPAGSVAAVPTSENAEASSPNLVLEM
jgi:hypothetical protein